MEHLHLWAGVSLGPCPEFSPGQVGQDAFVSGGSPRRP